MLIVLATIGIIGIIAGIIMCHKMCDETPGFVVIGISTLLLVVSVIAILVCGGMLIDGRYIPEKIEAYEEDRAEAYVILKDILNDTQSAINNDALIVDVNQLNKTDPMKQYIEYTQEITKLKVELINLNVVRWWMYFGK